MRLTNAVCALFLLLALAAAPAAASVINGGFETGDFTGWTLAGAGVSNGVPIPGYVGVVKDSGPHSGDYNAYLADPSGLTFLYQTFTTVPGQEYLVSFWYAQQPGPQLQPANEFEVYSFLDVSSPATSLDLVYQVSNDPVRPWTYEQASFEATEAASGILFVGANVPGWFALDDINVVATPEPAVALLTMLGLGFLAAAGTRLRRRTAAN